MDKVRAYIRCRPLRSLEKGPCLQVDEEHREIKVQENKIFQFDGVFSQNSSQIEVYMMVVSPLVKDIFNGLNCTVFTYGPTGTGKTFTMEGEIFSQLDNWEADSLCGIVPRTASQIFQTLKENGDQHADVTVSFLELYNEEAYDLLAPIHDTQKLKIYDNGNEQIVDGLQAITVKNREDVYQLLRQGSNKRATESTRLNSRSSRSHTVFSITLCTSEGTKGKMNLIDLAGSENVGRSGAQEMRAREAFSINQSLLTLGRVIKALVDKSPHVPYRESKLTRLLQSSLGGSGKTSIIATISPSLTDIEETLNTLEYATRAKGVTNNIVLNQTLVNLSTNQSNDIIAYLKRQLFEQEYIIRNEAAKEYRKATEENKAHYELRYGEEIKGLNQENWRLNQELMNSNKENARLKESLKSLEQIELQYKDEITRVNQLVMDSNEEIRRLKDELLKAHDQIDQLTEMTGSQSQCSPITTPKMAARKATRVKKNLLDVSGDYANVTFDNEDEIAPLDIRRSKKKIIACTKKREINPAITLSGKKRKLQTQDEQIELSPCKRVTRSRKKLLY